MIDFEKRCAEYVSVINGAADRCVSASAFEGRESEGLAVMLKAMDYSLGNAATSKKLFLLRSAPK